MISSPRTAIQRLPASSAPLPISCLLRLLDFVWPTTTISIFAWPWPDDDLREDTHHLRELMTVGTAHHPTLAEGEFLVAAGAGVGVVGQGAAGITRDIGI